MALDTSKFTSDKDAGDGYRDYRKACQMAFDDINTVLEPKPKINKIMATNVMHEPVIEKIGACVGEDAEGNPIWTNDRATKLKPETIELYSFLISAEGMAQMGFQLPAAEPEAEAQAEATTDPSAQEPAGPKFAEEGQECPGWVNKTGPDPRYKETCDACSRVEACAAQVAKPKAAAKEKKPKEPKPPKEIKEVYSRVNSVCDCLKEGQSFTKESLAKAANDLYIQHGGKDNIKESSWAVNTFLKPLLLMGAVIEVSGNYQKA